MKILVTGGAGFIGSNFVRMVLKEHSEVDLINLDKLTYASIGSKEADVQKEIGKHGFIRADILEPQTYQAALSGVEAIVHFAAETHVDRSFDDAEPFRRTNEEGTAQLLQAARRADVRRFIHISTDEVYGEALDGVLKRETDLPNPTNPYSASKLAAEKIVLDAQRRFGDALSISILRGTNNYGPYQFPEKVIPLFITQAFSGEPLPLYGDGLQEREWLFVEDFCRAIWLILKKGAPGEIYNVGSGERMTNRRLAEIILDLCGGAGASPGGRISPVKDRPVHDRRYAVNFEKIQALGFAPRHRFAEALPSVVEWYRARADWWQPIRERRSHQEFQTRWYARS